MHLKRQVFKNCLPIAHRLDVDNELAFPGGVRNQVIKPAPAQGLGELRFVQANQRLVMSRAVLLLPLVRGFFRHFSRLHDKLTVGTVPWIAHPALP